MEITTQNETYMSLKKRIEKMEEKDARTKLRHDIIQGVEVSKLLIEKIQNDLQSDSSKKYDLCKLLMKLSAELKSNYILREDKIENISEAFITYLKNIGVVRKCLLRLFAMT